MQNIEIKARVTDPAELGRLAAEAADGEPRVLEQIDTYFDSATGRLKLREEGRFAELIYYERSDSGGPRPSTYERIPVERPDELKRVLSSALGTRAVVRKRRLLFMCGNVRIHLDTVEGLGQFIELEGVAADPSELSGCESQVVELLDVLGIADEDLVPVSYSDLLMERQQKSATLDRPSAP